MTEKKKLEAQSARHTRHDWFAALKPPQWQHEAATALHGWHLHEYHEGAPLMLSQDDYEAALDAASKAPLEPHLPAASKHAPALNRDDARQGAKR